MKKLRKMIGFLLVLALVWGLVPTSFAEPEEVLAVETPTGPTSGTCGALGTGENIQWQLTPDTEADWDIVQGQPYKLTLTGSGEMANYNFLDSPWYSYHAFITSISIEEGITCIGKGAFEMCSSLKSITIPDSVMIICENAFSNCVLLESIVCGKGLKKIEKGAFLYAGSLVNITFNEGLEEIGNQAFAYCYSLKKVSLPDSLTTLGLLCFMNTSLESLEIPQNAIFLKGGFLGYCNKLKSIQVAEENTNFQVLENILYEMKEGIPYRAVACPLAALPNEANIIIADGTEIVDKYAFGNGDKEYQSRITSVTLPNTLKKIEIAAFQKAKIMEINIPDSVETIETGAFGGCDLLESVTVGSGLQEFVAEAYHGCSLLEIIEIAEENPYLDAIDNVIYNKQHTELCMYAPAKPDITYHLLNTVEKLDDYSIYNCTFLKELYLPQTLTFIGMNAIYSNKNLNSIYFEGNAHELQYASKIGGNANDLILYRTASSTGWDDKNWSSFQFAEWDPQNTVQESGNFGSIVWKFDGTMGKLSLIGSGEVPDFTEEAPAPWSSYIGNIQTVEAEQISGIGNYAFRQAANLLRLETDAEIKRIGDYAFADCGKLLFVDITAAETIGTAAFQNDTAILNNLAMDKVSAIGPGAFKGCSAITDVTLGAKLSALEEEVFAGCTSLRSFIIPESVSEIKSQAFQDCVNLYSINIPANVNTVGAQAFTGDTALQKVYFYGGVPQNWETDSFTNCNDNLTIYYRAKQPGWSELGQAWNSVVLARLDRFYTERQDHYSFDNSSSSFGYESGYRIPRQRYVDVIDSIAQGTYFYATDLYWRGSCYGMASSTLEFYENPDKYKASDYMLSAENLYALSAPRSKNAPLTKLIEAYQVSQYKSVIASYNGSIGKNMGNYRGLIQRVEEFERSGGLRTDSEAEPVILCMSHKNSNFGHAVIPVSVEQAENGDFLLQVYDSNFRSGLQTLTVYKDFSGIQYGPYTDAGYISYSTVAAAMSGVELHEEVKDNSLYLAIDKEQGNVVNAEGKTIEEIEGAYEQKLFGTGEEEQTFSGVRRFVLPKGEYKLIVEEKENIEESNAPEGSDGTEEQGVTFYMATGANYAKVNSSDEKAILDVKESTSEAGALTIELQSESTEQEKASITLVNTDGMERTVDVTGSSATVTVAENDSIAIQVPTSEAVSIDGKEVEVKDGQVESSFEAAPGENPLKAGDLDTNVSCDAQNKLSGKISATVVSNASAAQESDLTAEYLDSKGKVVASYTEKKQLKPGLNTVELSFDSLAADFGESTGEVMLSCRFTVTDQAGHSAAAIVEDIKVSLTEKPGTEDPDKPGVEDPDKPGTEDPDKPGVEDPDKPGTEDPDKPGAEDPDKPGIEDPDKPGAEDPDKPGIEDPDKPGTEDPDKPGTEDPDNPGDKPGTEDPDKPGITEVEVKGVSVSEGNLMLGVGEKIQLKAVVVPENATNKTLVYKTSNDNAQVSETGLVTAKKVGTATITVEARNGKKAEVEVAVKKAPEKITLNAQSKALKPGETFQIKVTLPKDCASRSITYASSEQSVAEVSPSGKITAKKKGNTVITVQTYNGKKAQMKVDVKVDVAVRTVSLSDKKLTLGAGEKYQLNASIRPKNATDQKLTYKASGNKVKVTGKGLVTAKKPGKAAITVKARNGKKATVTITVKKAPKKVTLNAKKKTLKVGKKYQIKTKLPKGTASRKLTYTSSKKKVASVTSTGKVTAKKKGSATITVKTFNGKKAKLKIIVK